MSSAGRSDDQPVDMLLGRQALLCLAPGARGQAPRLTMHTHDGVSDALAQALRGLKGRQRVRLWLSGHWARPFLLEPVAGVQRWSEWQALAQGMATQRTGLPGPCSVWFSHRPGRQTTLAVAVPKDLAAQCQQAVHNAGHQLVQLRPWWSDALNHALVSTPPPAKSAGTHHAVAVLDADSLTVLAGPLSPSAGVQPAFALASTLTPAPAADQVHAALARLAFARGIGVQHSTVIHCLSFGAEAAEASDAPSSASLPFLLQAPRTEASEATA